MPLLEKGKCEACRDLLQRSIIFRGDRCLDKTNLIQAALPVGRVRIRYHGNVIRRAAHSLYSVHHTTVTVHRKSGLRLANRRNFVHAIAISAAPIDCASVGIIASLRHAMRGCLPIARSWAECLAVPRTSWHRNGERCTHASGRVRSDPRELRR